MAIDLGTLARSALFRRRRRKAENEERAERDYTRSRQQRSDALAEEEAERSRQAAKREQERHQLAMAEAARRLQEVGTGATQERADDRASSENVRAFEQAMGLLEQIDEPEVRRIEGTKAAPDVQRLMAERALALRNREEQLKLYEQYPRPSTAAPRQPTPDRDAVLNMAVRLLTEGQAATMEEAIAMAQEALARAGGGAAPGGGGGGGPPAPRASAEDIEALANSVRAGRTRMPILRQAVERGDLHEDDYRAIAARVSAMGREAAGVRGTGGAF